MWAQKAKAENVAVNMSTVNVAEGIGGLMGMVRKPGTE